MNLSHYNRRTMPQKELSDNITGKKLVRKGRRESCPTDKTPNHLRWSILKTCLSCMIALALTPRILESLARRIPSHLAACLTLVFTISLSKN